MSLKKKIEKTLAKKERWKKARLKEKLQERLSKMEDDEVGLMYNLSADELEKRKLLYDAMPEDKAEVIDVEDENSKRIEYKGEEKHEDYCLDHNVDKKLPECICKKEEVKDGKEEVHN